MRSGELLAHGGAFVAVLALFGCASGGDGEGTNNSGLDGGVLATGGVTGSGGSGAGGVVNTGGAGNTGGIVSTGGVAGSGGVVTTGGFGGSGGIVTTGGFGGSGGIVNTGGIGSGGIVETGGSGGATATPACMSSPSQVVMIGDSYITGAASPALQPALGMLYPSANSFRNYAVAGTSMATGGITGLIPPQLTTAISVDPDIRLVIMDGGGNDVLICDTFQFSQCNMLCNNPGSDTVPVCQQIVDRALQAGRALMQTAADAGIHDTIYFFYPHIPANNGGYTDILDYAEPLVKDMCDGAEAATGGQLRCHFVDLIQPFIAAGGDRNPANFAGDGIHPSAAGQAIIAQQIWNVMQSDCLGQPSSSGCCTP